MTDFRVSITYMKGPRIPEDVLEVHYIEPNGDQMGLQEWLSTIDWQVDYGSVPSAPIETTQVYIHIPLLPEVK